MSHPIDTAALQAWLAQLGIAGHGLSVQPISGGQSNPTYRIDVGGQRLVLRKKPPGKLLPGAHAIEREYRVMQALEATAVPVPRMVAWCDDTGVLGTEFYLMAFVEGRVLMDQSLPGLSAAERLAIYDEMNRVIAALHAVDPAAVGLADFGRPGAYLARQIARWSSQCTASPLPVSDDMRRLMEWLPQHIPPEDDETTLVHGDFRLDNLVFHPQEPRVVAVLDWELSTLGHPVADFAYHCMSWRIPASLWRGIGGLDLQALGLPTEQAYVGRYLQATGRQAAAAHWEFYMAYNLFRMAAILHGIAVRAAQGNAASADAVQTGAKAAPLAAIGWQCAQRHAATRH